MTPPSVPPGRGGPLRRLAFAASCALALGFALTWAAGMFAYTCAGIDREEVEGDRVLVTYYRLRWPGDGSVWAGFAAHHRPLADGPPDRFDLGGSFFEKPKRPASRSFCERLGFRRVGRPAEDPFRPARYPGAVRSGWLAVPGWLPALLFSAWPARRLARRRRRGQGPAPPGATPDHGDG